MQYIQSLRKIHIVGYAILGFFIVGLNFAFEPSHTRPKTAMVIQLETMLDQCKDSSECQAIKNVLAREIKIGG